MCKKLLFLAVLLVFVGSACGDITTGLVGHWKMDDGVDSTVADSSGNGNDGTIGGSDTWIEGGGIDFDGGSWGASGIVFANSGADLIADMNLADEATFSYLVTWDVNEYTGTNYPYDGRDVNSVRIFSMECTDSYNMRNFFGGADQYSWNALNDTHEDFIFDEVGKSWGDYIRVTTTIDFNTGIYKLYVDDQVYASGTGKTGSCSGMTTFTIGRTLWGEMEGKMKDFRIYDRALSADDLAELLAGDYSHSPVPGDGADWPHYSTSEVTLEWAAGLSAASHDVYFGTDYNSVADANTESDEFMDNVEVTSYYVDGMSADSTYYWRIDEVNGIDVWEGDVWSFYTEDEWGKPGWILTFHDEFSTGTVPDSNKWKIGSWSSYSYPNYFPSDDPNVYTISNGTLKLHNVIDDYYDPGTETTKHYGAGKLQSDDIFDQAYGYFECSAKLPVGNGSFPAFWMMPEPSGGTWWPNAEIDIMEHVYRDNSIGKIGANMHWNDYDEDHVSWSSLFEGADTYYTFSPTSTAYNDFHVYAVKWEPNEMFFYVDGYNYATFRNDDVPESMYENEPDSYNPADIKAPASTEYLILNNGLAGWVEIDGEGATSTFEIDYVRVYTRDMDYDEPNSNLVCWWQMDQSSGTTVTDTQENMDGTMGNNNYWDANTIYFTGDNYGASGVSSDESIFSGISDEITFAFWAKIDVANTVENGYFFTAKVNGTRVFQIDLSGNESKSLWYKGLGSEVCGVGGIWTPDWGVNPEEFNHYAFTKNATTSEMSLYVNGMLKDRITDANSTFADIDLFEICGASSNWHQWAGNVKDFRIYDKALSDSEIERLSTPIIASEFMPADGQIAEANENSDLTLYWKSGLDAADVNGHRVYFGEDYNSVNDATIISDEYQGTQTANSYDLYSLSDVNTYYWRIDEVNGVDVWKGDTCSFTINHNITFFITSDIHYGRYQVADNEQDNKNLIARMNYMPSKLHYPVELGGELVNRPRAVLAAGDLTDYGEANEWEGYDEYDGFVDDFLGVLNYQLYEGYGNHDSGLTGTDDYAKQQVKARNLTRPGITNLSTNDYHYSWDWNNVHFVNLNLYPGPQGGRWAEAEGSIDFLISDLAANVGVSDNPVVIYHHFGMDDRALTWWEPEDANTYYEAIESYNVIAIFHGHSHDANVYQWNGIDVYDVGTATQNEWAVVNITDDELMFGSLNQNGWQLLDIKSYSVNPPTAVVLTYDNFESGFGNYTDGGGDCSRYIYGTYAYKDSCAINIQDNSGVGSSFYHTSGIDVNTPGYEQIKVEFSYYGVGMNTGHDFWVEYYDGNDWNTVATYVCGTDFNNGSFYTDTVTIDSGTYDFPIDMKIRFQCSAGNNLDDVYIDDITVSAE